jgi:aminopeptidase N
VSGQRLRPARPRLLAVAAAVVLAACTSNGVSTGSAVVPTTTTTAEAPPSTEAPATSAAPPPTSAAQSSAAPPSTAAGDPSQPSLGVGDRLYPELGSADLDVQSYLVQLRYDAGSTRLDATVTVTTTVDRPLDVLALDARQLTVDGVSVDGATAAFQQADSELLVDAPTTVQPGRPVAVAVTYHDDQHGAIGDELGAGWYPTPGGSYVLDEPDGARNWLPSNDTPSDKATWRFEITVPDGLTGVANGRLVEQRPAPGGSTWVWDEPAPMATYQVQVLTGDYQVLAGGTVGNTTLTNVALRDDVGRMQTYFGRTAEQLAYFEGLFGPYPFASYGLAFLDSRSGLAMETLSRSQFSRDDFPGQQSERTEMFQSHELAHQWFGDAVTPRTWDDLWLNESFATYGQWLWLDHVGLIDLEQTAATVLAGRQGPSEPTGVPSRQNLFGFERYDGGAVVLHALRKEVGDDAFFRILRRWAADNAGTSRTTADFIALSNEVAGRDLTAFFQAWLYAPSLPPTFPG